MTDSAARLSSRPALCGLVVGLVVANTAAGATSLALSLHDGRLTADVAGVPVRQVMDELGRVANAEVRWLGRAAEEPVSVHFTDVPLGDAVRRVLGTRSFLVVVPGGGSSRPIARVIILASGPGASPEPQTTRAPQAAPSDGADDAAIATALAPEAPAARIRAIEELGWVAEPDSRAWMTLSHLSRDEEDEGVREAARSALGLHI